MKFIRNWGPSTYIGAGFAALMLILVFVTPSPGPFGWLLVLFAVLAFTSLYSLASGRRSWLKYSGRKLAAIGLAGSLIVGFVSLGVAATAMPHTSPAADANRATGGPTASSPAVSASATPTRSATPTPTATPTATPTSTPTASPSAPPTQTSPAQDPAPQAPVAEAPPPAAAPAPAPVQAPPPAAAPAPAPVQAPPPAAAPAPAPVQNYVTPGAFCKTALAGTTAYSKDGVLMVCSKTATDPYYRWRRA